MKIPNVFFLITCEHAGNEIPKELNQFFYTKKAILALNSHRGMDIGALKTSLQIKDRLGYPFFFTPFSRLLIDCNRSLNHPKLFSEFSKNLQPEVKDMIIKNYYLPYRQKVIKTIKNALNNCFIVYHFSIHSFTPKLNDVIRNNHIGLLYDPKRLSEKKTAIYLKDQIKLKLPELKTRFNYPYLGKSDGFTSFLRKHYSENQYIGIEIELNQNLFFSPLFEIQSFSEKLANCLKFY